MSTRVSPRLRAAPSVTRSGARSTHAPGSVGNATADALSTTTTGGGGVSVRARFEGLAQPLRDVVIPDGDDDGGPEAWGTPADPSADGAFPLTRWGAQLDEAGGREVTVERASARRI